MKVTLVIYGVLIVVLFVWLYIQSRALSALNAKIVALTPTATPPAVDGSNKKTGDGDWMGQLQTKIKKIDVEFNS